MSIFGNLKLDADVDTTPFTPQKRYFDSGVTQVKVKTARTFLSPRGSRAIELVLESVKDPDNTATITTYITTSGDAPRTYYVGKDKKKRPLPGYANMDEMCKALAGKPLAELSDPEKAHMNIWNRDLGKVAPTEVDMLMDLVGVEGFVGAVHGVRRDPAGDRKDFHFTEAKAWFNEAGFSVVELDREATEPAYINAFHEANKDKLIEETFQGTAPASTKAAAPVATQSLGI